jgi:hypothetical protein
MVSQPGPERAASANAAAARKGSLNVLLRLAMVSEMEVQE